MGFAVSAARSKIAGISKTETAAVVIIPRLNLIVVSSTARRDSHSISSPDELNAYNLLDTALPVSS
jgi:hypothetical protein